MSSKRKVKKQINKRPCYAKLCGFSVPWKSVIIVFGDIIPFCPPINLEICLIMRVAIFKETEIELKS